MTTLFSDQGDLPRMVALVVKMDREWNNLMAWGLKELWFLGGSRRSKALEVIVINKEDVYITTNSYSTQSWDRKQRYRGNSALI